MTRLAKLRSVLLVMDVIVSLILLAAFLVSLYEGKPLYAIAFAVMMGVEQIRRIPKGE